MIPAHRFEEQSRNREAWLEARRFGVTATEVARAATPAGFKQALAARHGFGEEITVTSAMQFGLDQEPKIMRVVKFIHGVLPNDWLISSETDWRYLATPDGLSVDHQRIAEVKTGSNSEYATKIPIHYRRQMQWQLFVTGAKECVYAYMLRVDDPWGVCSPAWVQPKITIVPRDEAMISGLVRVADQLLIAANDMELAA